MHTAKDLALNGSKSHQKLPKNEYNTSKVSRDTCAAVRIGVNIVRAQENLNLLI